MELCCPACGARYRIEADRWPARPGDDGTRPRRARCTACGTIFTAAPTAAASTAAAEAPPGAEEGEFPEGDRPEDDEPENDGPDERRWRWPLPLAAALLVLALPALLVLRPAWVEAATGWRPPAVTFPAVTLPTLRLPRIGLPRTTAPPLRIEPRALLRQLPGGRHAFEVTGSIHNPGQQAYAVPPVELLLLDSAGRIVDRWTARAEARSLAPGEATRFESSNVDPPAAAIEVRARLKPAELGRP